MNNNKKLRVIFMGSPDVAVPFLDYLIKTEAVVGVFTAPDLPAGRHMHLKISSVKKLAVSNDIPVFQPESLKDGSLNNITKLKPDLIVVVAYGYKLPQEILDIPRYKSINIHFSLLPKYRGAAPVNWALVNGEKETGVTSFFLRDKMDAGDIILKGKVIIDDDNNAKTLLSKLAGQGLIVLENTIRLIKNHDIKPLPQDENAASFAPKLNKADGKIGWGLSSLEIRNRMRGFYPWPGSYTYLDTVNGALMVKMFEAELGIIEEEGNIPGEVLNICKDRGLLVKCGHGALWIRRVQLQGHKILTGYEFFVGRKIKKGDIFEG